MTAGLLYSYVIKTLVRLRVSISYLNFPIEIFYQNKSAAVNHGVSPPSSEQKVSNILKAKCTLLTSKRFWIPNSTLSWYLCRKWSRLAEFLVVLKFKVYYNLEPNGVNGRQCKSLDRVSKYLITCLSHSKV